MRSPSILLSLLLLCGGTALAAPAPKKAKAAPPKKAAPAGPVLKSIAVTPTQVTLVGARAEQGLVVTGTYADGTVRDLTRGARFAISNPQVVAMREDSMRPELVPAADGTATVKVTVGSAPPVNVAVVVKNSKGDPPISFRDEVIPALTKAGCNQGLCHGTPTGKGGFKLSLQGYAPELDYRSLVHEGGARRLNRADPSQSLLLAKPLLGVPHKGGKKLAFDMPEYEVLSRWIAEGANDDRADAPTLTRVEVLPGARYLMLPGGKQQVTAVAHFSDGSVRDVTKLAKLSTSNEDLATISREGLVNGVERGDVAVLVRYQYALQSMRITFLKNVPGFQWNNPPAASPIDRAVFNRLKLFQIPASGLSSDAEFVRRAYLDSIGLLPSADEARKFVADSTPDKRARLIENLTARPEFADFWALKWADVLRIQDEALGENGSRAYHKWLRDSIAANKPWDQTVREMLTASGNTDQNPAANYFRTPRDAVNKVEPHTISEATSQVFLGVRMTCAKCHNHPFERWTQDEYYELAAFFSQVNTQSRGNAATVALNPNGEVEHIRTGKVMRPKLLGGDYPEIAQGQDRRVALANWMTRKDNPFFPKATVNRVWSHLLGRGIVEPIDDFRDSNPSVNDELLELLARDFTDHNFDLRHLVRSIMNSRTYQLTSEPLPLNEKDYDYFSHGLPRMLTAEQLADALTQITGVADQYPGYPAGTRASQIAGTKVRTEFLQLFGRPDRNLNCECERSREPTLLEALKLMTDRNITQKLRADEGRLAALAASPMPLEQALDELYLTALARTPSAKERTQWLAHFAKTPDRRQALEDVGWVLVNSKEFLFRR